MHSLPPQPSKLGLLGSIPMLSPSWLTRNGVHWGAAAVTLAALLLSGNDSFGAFGLTTNTDYYTVDTGAGLVFKVRRVEEAGANANTVSIGDIRSLVYNGIEYQNTARGSQINSGFDYLGYGNNNVSVTASVVNANYIKVTVTTANLTHYYIARNGYPHIYMATWFDVQPVTGGGLCRYIVRMPYSKLPNGPEPSDLSGTTYTVESGDIFGKADGQTRSKHYSNFRTIDWSYTGATGNGVGVFMVRDSQEGGSGGPFYRSLINQGGGDQEITYIINYGEAQTEGFRTSILNGLYTLVFTDGQQPNPNIDYSWMETAGLNLTGWIPQSGRGRVSGTADGIPDGFETVIGFANSTAQYWTQAAPDGTYLSPPMIPGTYTAKLYKQELVVDTDTVVVTANTTNALNLASTEATPAILWRIGDWDGAPTGLRNGDKLTSMHPSDVRMENWSPWPFDVASNSAPDFPCVQFRGANSPAVITFNLTPAQTQGVTLRIGTTCSYNGGRPQVQLNSWWSSIPAAPSWSHSRNITVGTYREFNQTYTYSIPASALVAGQNTLRIHPASGSSDLGLWLSASWAYDAIELAGYPVNLPPAPTGLAAIAGVSQFELRWTPVLAATHYIVRRATTADGPYVLLTDNLGPARFIDSGVTNDTTYFYRISAVNTLGESSPSELIATPSQLISHLKFDEASGATAKDSAGTGDGALKSGASWTDGRINNALQLDGSANGYVELPDGLVQNVTDCTFSTWVYATATPTWSRIFDFGSGTGSYLFLTPASADNTVRFSITLASTAGEQQLNRVGPLPLNGWHHIAVTLSGNTGKLYFDGALADTQTITLDPADLGLTRQNFIGKSQWSDPYPTAKVDDFRIYARALSASEIATLASQTLPDAPAALAANANTNQVMLTWSAAGGAASYNVKVSPTNGGPYTLLAGGLTGVNLTYTSARAGTNYYVVTAANLAGESAESPQANAFIVIPEMPQPPVAPVAYYRFEEGAAGSPVPPGGNVIVDSTGGDDNLNAYDIANAPDYSSLVPAAVIPQTGATNTVSTFYDGSDDLYTAISGPLTTSVFSNFTAEAYVRFTALAGWQTIVGRDDLWNGTGGLDGNPESLFYLSKNGVNNAFRVKVSTVGGDMKTVEGSAIAVANTWYHVAAVGDVAAGTLTLYVNGVSAGSTSGFDGLYPAPGQAWTFGRGQYNGALADKMTGFIDEVRFTASALSPNRFLNAFNPDTDADGLTDAWELAYFGNLNQTGTDDPDGDSVDNKTEETNGSNPTISSLPPRLEIVRIGNNLSLSWPSNHTGWILLTRTNTLDGIWTAVPNSGTNNAYEMNLDTTPGDNIFFRLIYP